MTSQIPTRARRAVALAAVVITGLGARAWAAPFHLHLVKSVPVANGTIAAAPDSIRLWFSQTPELAVTSLKVTGPSNATVALAPLAKRDSAAVVAGVKGAMAAGAYTVTWRTMAKDGHVARGTFAFTVGTAR
jgi:copper resistance protein C